MKLLRKRPGELLGGKLGELMREGHRNDMVYACLGQVPQPLANRFQVEDLNLGPEHRQWVVSEGDNHRRGASIPRRGLDPLDQVSMP